MLRRRFCGAASAAAFAACSASRTLSQATEGSRVRLIVTVCDRSSSASAAAAKASTKQTSTPTCCLFASLDPRPAVMKRNVHYSSGVYTRYAFSGQLPWLRSYGAGPTLPPARCDSSNHRSCSLASRAHGPRSPAILSRAEAGVGRGSPPTSACAAAYSRSNRRSNRRWLANRPTMP